MALKGPGSPERVVGGPRRKVPGKLLVPENVWLVTREGAGRRLCEAPESSWEAPGRLFLHPRLGELWSRKSALWAPPGHLQTSAPHRTAFSFINRRRVGMNPCYIRRSRSVSCSRRQRFRRRTSPMAAKS